VKALVEAILQEKELPPIEVAPDYRIIDGVHRYFAYKEVGREKVDVIVLDAGDDEYWERAVQANGAHGLAISLEDRRDAFARMWEHHLAKDWKNKKTSFAHMGEVFCVSKSTIKRWVDEREPERKAVTRPPTTLRASQEPSAGAPASPRGDGAQGHRSPSIPEVSKESKAIDYLRSALLQAADSDVDEISLREAIDKIQDHQKSILITTAQSAWPKIKYTMDAWLKAVES
jgi:hypothetical protein